MTTFEKHYIGKGTQVENLDIIKIVIPVKGGSICRENSLTGFLPSKNKSL